MLKNLSIKSVAVIDELNIDFAAGLGVLSGETGAGKSIIIDAINLLKGERGSKSLIRSGENRARVTGVFELGAKTAAKISEIMGSDTEDELIISRELNIDGKNTIRINGEAATLGMLKLIGEELINIHGQHDNTSLLSVKTHIDYLDSYGANDIYPALKSYRECFYKCKEISDEIARLDTDEQEKLRRKDMLSFQIAELEDADLKTGEDEALLAQKLILDNAARISDNSQKAYDLLYGGENTSAHDMLWEAVNYLEKIAEFDADISLIYNDFVSIADNLDERVRDLRHISDNLSFDAEKADEIEQRLELIQNLKRKYGSTIEEILEFYDKATDELETIETSSERVEYLKSELIKGKNELSQKSKVLSDLREKKSKELSQKICSELCELNMQKVEFSVSITNADSFKPNGTDEIEFMVRTNVGEDIKPLANIASGGELSRIMLAIKSVLSKADSPDTLIFDEIDTGVSGSAAQKIGEKLKHMAKNNLVLCITHLPQIAALADTHYLIEKDVTDGRTRTTIAVLDFDQRINELARVLGTGKITDAAKANARQLLEDAHLKEN